MDPLKLNVRNPFTEPLQLLSPTNLQVPEAAACPGHTGAGRCRSCGSEAEAVVAIDDNVEAVIIRIGFWGPLYYNYKKETPK